MCFDQGEKSIIIYENFHYITSFHINRPKWYHKRKGMDIHHILLQTEIWRIIQDIWISRMEMFNVPKISYHGETKNSSETPQDIETINE